jgi:hypothetical protein
MVSGGCSYKDAASPGPLVSVRALYNKKAGVGFRLF